MDEKHNNTVKMFGYLEKKCKKRMLSTWKQYWFVLKGGLLLYYRSQDEYETLSPCKGSINLGPPCSVKPCSSLNYAFQIETRSSTITLKAECGLQQKKWIHCIMLVLNQCYQGQQKLNHFRYSLDEIVPKNDTKPDKNKLERQNSMPSRSKRHNNNNNNQMIQRLQKLGTQSYGGSLGALRRSMGMAPNNNLYEKNKDKSPKQSRNSFIINNNDDNEQYWNNSFKSKDCNDDVIYAEPQFITKQPQEDNAYGLVRKNSDNNENYYEELDEYSNYYYAVQCCNKKPKDETTGKTVKKSKSFIKKFWKKKDKKKEEDYYEIVKIERENPKKDNNTIEIISEFESNDKRVSTTEKNEFKVEQAPALPEKKLKQHQEKTIDEILNELEQESPVEARNNEEEVTLRHNDKIKNRFSDDELEKLLDELVKVTSAPLLTPGATSSLLNPNLTDDEWLKLLPIRKRRHSDPDYDIPRSHKSLQIAEDHQPEMSATRFFGPVSLDKNDNSITPDSLEVEREISYHSHHYYHFCKGMVCRDNQIHKTSIYQKNPEETFCDSLEIN